MPGGGMPGGGRTITGAPRTCGIIIPGAGAPTPGAGPAKPAGANPGPGGGIPRPAALPIPGPAITAAARANLDSSAGGGPSTVRSITSSPRKITRPSTRRCSLSSSGTPFLGGSFRYSSASPSTKFIWRSKAINLPIICRPSVTVTRIPAVSKKIDGF